MSQVIIGDILPYTQATATLNQVLFGTNWTANVASDVVVYQTPFGSPPNDATQILTSNQFSVAFIGGSQEVQVTLVTGAGAGDIITITRQTPADRENLYSNTNFTPSMLNQDFGILTLVDQQAQLVDQLIGPRYNYSAVIAPNLSFPNANIILPILTANQTWVKNNANTAIVALDVPAGGIAPADATYVLLTDNAALPNAQALADFGVNGILAWNNGTGLIAETSILGTANQITVANGNGIGTIGLTLSNNPIMPGSAGMGIPIGTTGQRVIPGSNISLRFNTTLGLIEYWTGSVWSQLNTTSEVNPGLINELAWYAADGSIVSGLATAAAAVLTTVASVPTWATELSLALGGTNASLTASNGGIFYSTASAGAILSGTATANQVLLSGSSTTPAWSTATYPATTTINQLLFSSANNVIGGVTAGNYGVLISSSTGVPSWLTNGTTGQILTATTSGTPSWEAPAASSVTFTGDSGTPFSGNAVTVTGGTTGLTFGAATPSLTLTGTLAVGHGGTGVTSVTVSPTATAFAGWDANKNMSANSFIDGYRTTATAAAITTLTVADAELQFFTGATTQTVVMPVTSTLVLGQHYRVVNNSTGVVTVQSSGANTIFAMPASSTLDLYVVNTGVTTAAGWYAQSLPISGSGTVNSGTINQLAYYASTSSTLSGLATANNGVLTTDGSGVPSITLLSNLGINASLIKTVKFQKFTATGSSSYTPSTGMLYCTVTGEGGGAGGGGAASSGAGATAGSGGGAGGRAIKTYTAALIGANAAIVINTGGTGGLAGNNNGNTGGSATFTPAGAGAVLTCNGGLGGNGSASVAAANGLAGGTGGTATGGDINVTGQQGYSGLVLGIAVGSQEMTGGGANSLFGTGAPGSTGGGAGANGSGNGSGGAGACNNQAGGNGTTGIFYIVEYCNQ